MLYSKHFSAYGVEVIFRPPYEEFLNNDRVVIDSLVASFSVGCQINDVSVAICFRSWSVSMTALGYPDPIFKQTYDIRPEVLSARQREESVRRSMTLRNVIVDPIVQF